jgi:hypothetical protein
MIYRLRAAARICKWLWLRYPLRLPPASWDVEALKTGAIRHYKHWRVK